MSVNVQQIGAASLLGDGTIRFLDDGFASASRTGVGVYELVLSGSIPPSEALPLATPWADVGQPTAPFMVCTTFDVSGGTLRVVTFDGNGAPADSAFSLMLYRAITT